MSAVRRNASKRTEPRGGRVAAILTWLVGVVVIGAAATTQAQGLTGDQYWQAVELYRQGHRQAADEALANMGPAELASITRQVNQLVEQASRCESCDARRELSERPLLAAALLHTDRAWPDDGRFAFRGEIDAAYALVRAAELGHTSSLSRPWLLAVTLRAHAAADGSLAIHWVEEAARRFPDDATFLLVQGAIEEALCGFSSLGVERPLEVGLAVNARLTRAKRHYDAALREDPDLHEARLRRGRVRALLGDTGADDDLRYVAEEAMDPRLVYLARLFLGRLLEVRGKAAEAANEYRAAADAFPGRTAHLALSHLLTRQGRNPRFPRRELEKAVGNRPQDIVDPFRDYPWGRSRQAAQLLDQLRTREQ
jgi:tetratricopeptide (TPR) repeat protein